MISAWLTTAASDRSLQHVAAQNFRICTYSALTGIQLMPAHSGGYVCGWPRRFDHAP